MITLEDCIAIGWDKCIQAVHAVGAATAFIQNAKRIHVLTVEEPQEETADPHRLVEYLAWHGLNAEGKVVPRAHEQVGHALLATAREIEASLLVMGATPTIASKRQCSEARPYMRCAKVTTHS